MLSWQLRDINDFLLLYRLHKTIWIFHAARGNQPAWWLYSASHPSGTQLWTTTVLLIRMVLCPGWDLWKLFSSTSFPALFHTPSRITLNTTNVSLVYHEMRKLSSSTQGESLLLLQKVSTEEQNSVTNTIPFPFWISINANCINSCLCKANRIAQWVKQKQYDVYEASVHLYIWCFTQLMLQVFLVFSFLLSFSLSTQCNSRPVPVHPSWGGWPELHQYLRLNILKDLHRIDIVFSFVTPSEAF